MCVDKKDFDAAWILFFISGIILVLGSLLFTGSIIVTKEVMLLNAHTSIWIMIIITCIFGLVAELSFVWFIVNIYNVSNTTSYKIYEDAVQRVANDIKNDQHIKLDNVDTE